MEIIKYAGWAGLLLSLLVCGFNMVLAAVLYGLVYMSRRAEREGVRPGGLLVLASFLFWYLVIFDPATLVITTISLFVLEMVYSDGDG